MGEASAALKIGFVHAFPLTLRLVAQHIERFLPEAEVYNIVDELMKVRNNRAEPGITPRENITQMVDYARALEHERCRAVFSCCSMLPEAATTARRAVGIPVLQLDAPLFAQAVALGSRVGLLAANPRALPHAQAVLRAAAQRAGQSVRVTMRCCEAAYRAMGAGGLDHHDALLLREIETLAPQVDCVVLAQINLGLLERQIAEAQLPCPVLCAGSVVFETMAKALREDDWAPWGL